MANELRYRATIKDDVSGPLERIKDKFGKLREQGAKPILQGLAIGAGAAAFNLLGDAVSNVVGWLGESIGKAREEEVSIAKLNAALKANVAGYNGNSEAVEKVIDARQRLAFADDEQRSSLAVLVTRTKDYNKALDLQRIAMDLARLKGIDLATASEVIGKVYSGNIGILTRYGIAVEKGSDATSALAQVSRAAAGQAEAFANTTEGSMQGAQIAIENLQEEIGVALLPAVKEISQWVRDDGVPALNDLVSVLKETGKHADELRVGLDLAFNGGRGLMQDMADDAKRVEDRTRAIADLAQNELAKKWDTGSERVATAIYEIAEAADKGAVRLGRMRKIADNTTDSFKDLAARARDVGDAIAEATYGPEELQLAFEANRIELGRNVREMATLGDEIKKRMDSGKKPTTDQKDRMLDLRREINEGKQEAIRLGVRLQAVGGISMADLNKQFGGMGIKLDGLTGKAADLWWYINHIANVDLGTAYDNKKRGKGGRAAGGPVHAGGSYLVGENGPEILNLGPSQNGTINPSSSGSGGGGGGGNLYINVSTPALTPGGAQALADALGPHITRWQQVRGL